MHFKAAMFSCVVLGLTGGRALRKEKAPSRSCSSVGRFRKSVNVAGELSGAIVHARIFSVKNQERRVSMANLPQSITGSGGYIYGRFHLSTLQQVFCNSTNPVGAKESDSFKTMWDFIGIYLAAEVYQI